MSDRSLWKKKFYFSGLLRVYFDGNNFEPQIQIGIVNLAKKTCLVSGFSMCIINLTREYGRNLESFEDYLFKGNGSIVSSSCKLEIFGKKNCWPNPLTRLEFVDGGIRGYLFYIKMSVWPESNLQRLLYYQQREERKSMKALFRKSIVQLLSISKEMKNCSMIKEEM